MPREQHSTASRLERNVRRLLDEREMTQADLGELIGKSQGGLSQILSGKRSTPITTIDDIASALGVDHVDLLRHSPDVRSGGTDERAENALPDDVHLKQDARYLSQNRDAGGQHDTAVEPIEACIDQLRALAARYQDQLDVLISVSDAVNDRTAALVAASDQQQREAARFLKTVVSRISRLSDRKVSGKSRR